MICDHCWGKGEICICPDDICQGSEECIHGDGMVICENCGGTGEVDEIDDDYRPDDFYDDYGPDDN